MSVKIINFSYDKLGRTTGGAPNANLAERIWYNKPWDFVFRPSNDLAEKIASETEKAVKNKHIIFSIKNNTDLFYKTKDLKWDLDKLEEDSYCDSPVLISVLLNKAGVKILDPMSYDNMKNMITRTNKFNILQADKITKASNELKRGDIIFCSTHCAIVVSDGVDIKKTIQVGSSNLKSDVLVNSSFCGKGIGIANTQSNSEVKTGPDTFYSTIAKISRGTQIEVLAILSNGWYRICWPRTESGYGYVKGSNFKFFSNEQKEYLDASIVMYAARVIEDKTKIYKEPSLDSDIVEIASNIASYVIVQEYGNFGKIRGMDGWILLDNLQKL